MNMGQLTFLLEEHPANRSASRVCAEDWQMIVATWRSNISALLIAHGQLGWYGRTSPESCPQTEEGILVPSSGAWQNSGMGSPTQFLTLSGSEFRSGAVACSLSDILETGALPQRFFLSAKACRGILRRAEKRGKTLPAALERSLRAVTERTATTL
jgi:hypothetical protein